MQYTRKELADYVKARKVGLSPKSMDWLNRSARELWDVTHGALSRESCTRLREYVITKFNSRSSHVKVLAFSCSFLKHLTKLHLDERYVALTLFLEMPKTRKVRKSVTSRIITMQDIQNVITAINALEAALKISGEKARELTTFILMGTYTGQRPQSTLASLTVGQIRDALSQNPPVLQVRSDQDKIRMAHYVPIHPRLIPFLEALCEGREHNEQLFNLNRIQLFFKRNPIHLSRCERFFTPSNCRKFAEQYGDILGWEQSNRSYILAHGVGGIEWAHYRSPLPEYVYANYMKYWGDVDLINQDQPRPRAIRDENMGALQEYPVLPMHS